MISTPLTHQKQARIIPPRPWHTMTAPEVAVYHAVEPAAGLTDATARDHLARVGPNRLRAQKHESLWETILEEVREPMVLLLLITGVFYGVWGELSDTITIFVVILIVVGVEIFNERRAERAIATLSALAEPTVPVRRAGQQREISAEEVVPGDVILLQEGRRVPADA